jgi:hypothetical protein
MGIERRFIGIIMGSKAFLTVKVCRIQQDEMHVYTDRVYKPYESLCGRGD